MEVAEVKLCSKCRNTKENDNFKMCKSCRDYYREFSMNRRADIKAGLLKSARKIRSGDIIALILDVYPEFKGTISIEGNSSDRRVKAHIEISDMTE